MADGGDWRAGRRGSSGAAGTARGGQRPSSPPADPLSSPAATAKPAAAKPPAPDAAAAPPAVPAGPATAPPPQGGDASAVFTLQSKSSVFDPAASRFSLKGVSPVVTADMAAGDSRALSRLVAADFFPALKGSADAVIVGDRNGTIDRVILRLSDPVYDRLTASVDFKATQRGVDAAPALKNGIVAGTSSSSASDKVAKVLKETGRPISLNNVAVFVDARATAPKGAKGVLPAGATAVDCTGWGCAA